MNKQKLYLTTIILIALLAIIFIFIRSNTTGVSMPSKSYDPLQSGSDQVKEGELVTLRGKITCLPKKGNGPQTTECAFGLKSQSGDYYSLNGLDTFDPDYTYSNAGTEIEVTGLLVGEKQTGTNENIYDTKAAIILQSLKPLTQPDSVSTRSIEQTKVIREIESFYPEFEDFENQASMAGNSIVIEKRVADYYAMYITQGSGLPIASATCFRVDETHKVYKVGEFPNPADSYYGYSKLDPLTCKGVK
jgi:hypothetical protein